MTRSSLRLAALTLLAATLTVPTTPAHAAPGNPTPTPTRATPTRATPTPTAPNPTAPTPATPGGGLATTTPGGATASRTPVPGGGPGQAGPIGAARSGTKSISVAVSSSGVSAPYYRVQVRNESTQPLDVVVRQGVPVGSALAAVSDGGQAAPTEVTWRVRLAPGATAPLSTSLTPAALGSQVVVPVCAFAPEGDQPYDCASAPWAAPPAPVVEPPPPWWQTLPALAGVLGLVLLTVAAGWWWRRTAERRRLATERFRQEMPRHRWRYGPPVWTLVTLSILLVAGVGLLVVRVAATQFISTGKAVQTAMQEGTGWIGDTANGQLGAPMREEFFEFAVYRVACQPAPNNASRCLATVGMRNVSGESQPWYGMLQRAYQRDGNWVPVDEETTRDINGGKDLFATPVPAGEDLLFPLAFTVPGDSPPDRIELRGGVFSAGVTVRCT